MTKTSRTIDRSTTLSVEPSGPCRNQVILPVPSCRRIPPTLYVPLLLALLLKPFTNVGEIDKEVGKPEPYRYSAAPFLEKVISRFSLSEGLEP